MLITGHKGFIGSYLFKKVDAIGIDRKEGNELLTCDLPDTDIVIHLAAQTSVVDSVADPEQDAKDNILVTLRLLKRYPKAKFIFASSGGAIQEIIGSPYGLSKLACENYIKLLHNNYVILRFPNVFGEGGKGVIEKFIEGMPTIYGSGEATRNYVHVEDITDGIIKALDWEKGLYMMGGGTQATVNELAESTGKKITYTKEREGEILVSKVENTTPNWKPTINAIDYVKNSCSNSRI
jgi:UDP-glucose 4-epimerase